MSFDLGVFYTEKPVSDREAVDRYVAFCEEEDLRPYIEPSKRVWSFLDELTSRYPQIDDWPEEDLENCPWSCAFDVSEGHVLMPMVFPRVEEMFDVIVALARKHGLVCVDPQSERIVTAPPGIRIVPKPWWKFW